MEQFLLLIAILLLGSVAYAASQGAPWVPTRARDFKRIERLLAIKPGERFVELGCGNGRVCRALEKIQPAARIEGVELSVIQYAIGWIHCRITGSRARIKFGNVFKSNLSDADVVYMFLMPKTYARIRPKLESELKPGSRVVTYAWPIEGWDPVQVDEVDGAQKIYLYKR